MRSTDIYPAFTHSIAHPKGYSSWLTWHAVVDRVYCRMLLQSTISPDGGTGGGDNVAIKVNNRPRPPGRESSGLRLGNMSPCRRKNFRLICVLIVNTFQSNRGLWRLLWHEALINRRLDAWTELGRGLTSAWRRQRRRALKADCRPKSNTGEAG